MMGKAKILKPTGFSVFDLVVALGIIVALSALIAVQLGSFRQTANLQADSEKMSALLRQAQLWALSGQTRAGVRPPGGWGVHLTVCATGACRYFLYADMFPVDPPNYLYDAGQDDIVTEYQTDSFVAISSLNPVNGLSLDINFTSPEAAVYVNGGQSSAQAVVTLNQVKTNEQQMITVDTSSKRINL